MGANHDGSSDWPSDFIDAYLDYLEGETDEPPTLDGLSDDARRSAETWVQSITAARGIDPYAQTPSIEQLAERSPRLRQLLKYMDQADT